MTVCTNCGSSTGCQCTAYERGEGRGAMPCRNCGVTIMYQPMEGHDWWHWIDGDPASPYLHCQPTTIAEPPT